jgi:hypothetical protein
MLFCLKDFRKYRSDSHLRPAWFSWVIAPYYSVATANLSIRRTIRHVRWPSPTAS